MRNGKTFRKRRPAVYCYCCDRRLSPDPCDCAALSCRRCLRCGGHCPCADPLLVGHDEPDQDGADEPVVVAAPQRPG
jgi:hypothetical protein